MLRKHLYANGLVDQAVAIVSDGRFVTHTPTSGMTAAAINGTISFAAELDSPFLREPSSAVADLTGRPATSVRMLLTAERDRLRAAAGAR